jgi:hypothetical protein
VSLLYVDVNKIIFNNKNKCNEKNDSLPPYILTTYTLAYTNFWSHSIFVMLDLSSNPQIQFSLQTREKTKREFLSRGCWMLFVDSSMCHHILWMFVTSLWHTTNHNTTNIAYWYLSLRFRNDFFFFYYL